MMRNPDAKHLDFGNLVGLIPDNPKILPSDLDLVYERKGKFLVAEFKRGEEKLSQGQKILLENLASLPEFNVFVVNGYSEQGNLVIGDIYWISRNKEFKKAGNGLDRFKQIITNWYASINDKS